MSGYNFLDRLSARRHERHVGEPNGGMKPATRESSWRRKSMASFSRRISSIPKPPQPSYTAKPSLTQVTSDGNEPAPLEAYERPVELIRQEEYPHMNHGTYLDHSGTTIHARSTVERFSQKMLSQLYGNPHSANEPAKVSGDMVDAIREKTLHFLGADPAHFDLIFTANATAAIKLVADSFRDLAEQTRSGTFWYGYHRDAHTSLVGVRELTNGDHHVFADDAEVEEWLSCPPPTTTTTTFSTSDPLATSRRLSTLGLFAYPGQSNLTGRRLPLSWPNQLRRSRHPHLQNTYTLLDAAALAMTFPLRHVFADPDAAPDFCCVSFYKIFGFPDLGGLVVRRESGHILALRKYFGGGTVLMVSAVGGAWHLSKGLEGVVAGTDMRGGLSVGNLMTGTGVVPGEGGDGGGNRSRGGSALHEGLEDGTLPFHSILALGEAIDVHAELYGSMENISAHTSALMRRMYRGMVALRYPKGHPLCRIYEADDDGGGGSTFWDARRQGATLAFNVFRADGKYEAYATVERLANERGVYVRSGGICCPGGLFTALQYEPWQLKRARSAGHHCGPNGLGLINELPTGVVRASLGAMSTVQDVDTFLTFLRETFIEGKKLVDVNRRVSDEACVLEEVDCVLQNGACCPA